MAMNKGVDIHCKSVTTQVFTALIVELDTSIKKPMVFLDAPPLIRQPSIKLTSKSPVIDPYLLRSFFFSSTLQSHR